MSDVKWIKFMVGTFDGRSFKKIRKAKIGGDSFRDKLTAVWFELLELAGKINDNGKLVESNELAFDNNAQFEDIATMIDREVDEVRLCITWYENNGMIEIIDDVYSLTNWCKYQSHNDLEKIKEQTRLRVAKHREQKRLSTRVESCAYCGGKATGLDHIVATSRGGNESEDNKVPCCIECNRIKNDKPLVDFLNSNRNRINDFLIIQNPKLNRYVTLCNVTNRYKETLPSYSISISSSNNTNNSDSNNITNKEYIKEIINYLNKVGNKKYTYNNKNNNSYINARLEEGHTLEDFKRVIDIKWKQWKETDMEKFFRPETLFCPKHFESYLNEQDIETKEEKEKEILNSVNFSEGWFD